MNPPGPISDHGVKGDTARQGCEGPGLRKVSPERAKRAERLRLLCAERHVSVRQLARHWDISKSVAHRVLTSESGPSSVRLLKLPESLRKAMGMP